MTDSKAELQKLLSILRIEKREGMEEYNSLLKNKSIKERRAAGICWYPVKIRETGYGLGDYPYIIAECAHARETAHQFQSGKMAGVFKEPAEGIPNCQGVINYVDGNRVKITFYLDELPEWMDDEKLGINLLFDEYSMKEMENAVEKVLKAENNRLSYLREVLSGNQHPGFLQDHHPLSIPHLNASQNEALNHVCAAKDIAIIHGPPGTGKTTTLVEVIKQLAKKEKKILVCAPSNAAVDLLTEKIAESGIKVLRLGNLARMDANLFMHTIEYKINHDSSAKDIKKIKKQADELRRMGSKYKRNFGFAEREQKKLIFKEARAMAQDAVKMENDLINEIIANAQVIATTLVGSAGKSIEKIFFNTLIIDEASQALEPATWIPISKAEKIVLAGDPFQLSPTVKSAEAQSKGLGITLIEKCLKKVNPGVLLNIQYRMNEHIMGFSNQQFYDNKLLAHESVKYHVIETAEPEFNQPIEFIDTAGCGFDEKINPETISYFNDGEFTMIRKHLELLVNQCKNDTTIDIGIISPYKQQVMYMREDLANEEFGKHISIDINTIDSFQGQERDVIYISLVRSNEKGEIGFLSDYRRMNVAMTRAKKKLVIVGDSATLGSHKFYRQFMEYVEKHGKYFTGWELM